ncbi:MAG: acetate kinase [Christensenellaceae bacterium]|jgi:acetate kinase|nr:acetate kinase [Christensenellaceae bacterium]
MNVLVINSGSSSLKFQLLNTLTGEIIKKGTIERIGEPSFCPSHEEAVRGVLTQIAGIKIDAIGHRVVQGGDIFKESVIINEKNLSAISELSALAPLHNPAAVMGIRACLTLLPNVKNVVVFDTAFHQTMPEGARNYAIPEVDRKAGIKKYGAHGTSHFFVAKQAAKILGRPLNELKLISCHIGNGASVCAIDKGKSVDTSMGLTPLEGLVMGTRSGDIDPAAVAMIAEKHGFSLAETVSYLNKRCGLKALMGEGEGDMRDVEKGLKNGDKNARLALSVFVRRLIKYIGAYLGVLNGADAIIWTAGVGLHTPIIREEVAKGFAFAGADIDKQLNDKINGSEGNRNRTLDISAENAKIKTLIIATNEELEIAHECERLI